MTRVLILDDDEKLARMLVEYLTNNGFAAEAISEPRAALARIAERPPDLLVLDLMMPGLDGLEVCREVRKASGLPIVMLTARGDEADRIVGLELGADDYLPKPFNPRELVARIRSVLRRASPAARAGQVLAFGRLRIDPDRREVLVEGRRVDLTSTEFDVLLVLARSPGVVLSREALLLKARGGRVESFDRSVDVHISHIRQKIEADPKDPRTIKTVWGEGYVFTGE